MNHRDTLRKHVERGLALLASGRMQEALLEVRSADRMDPEAAESLGLHGMMMLAQGRTEDAEPLLAQAFDRDADNVQWAVALGRARYRLRRWAQAETALRAAVGIDAALGDAWVLLGLVLRAAGRLSEAAGALERAVAIDARSDAALINLGNAYRDLGLHDRAGSCYRAACAAAPGSAVARYHLGVWLRDQDDAAAAVRAFETALELDPASIEARFNLAGMLCAQNRTADAALHIAHAVSLRPTDVALHLRGGALLAEYDRVQEARPLIERARALAPGHPAVLNNVGMLLHRAGELEDAIAAYDQALAQEPNGSARLNRALALLSVGRWREGWEDYAARWGSRELLDRLRTASGCECWDGGDLSGKSLLVLAEQGLGDEIMFASIVPELAVVAKRVILQCSVRLESLFRRSFPEVEIVAVDRIGADWPERVAQRAGAFGTVDCMTTVGDLARFRRFEPSAFPTRAAYLRCDSARKAAWQLRLAGLGDRPKIGLSWRGGTASTGRHRRSIDLRALKPLLERADVQFVSLQYGECVDEIRAFARTCGITIHHYPEAIEDYDETAALVCALDGVVSVCTAVVHLAGALGRPVHVLAPRVPEWRYGLSGCRMPWYASVVVHRQERSGEWDSVFAEVSRELPIRVVTESPARAHDDDGGHDADDAFHADDWTRAERAYADVLERRPDDVAARSNRATCLLQLGRLEEAIDEFRAALASAPDSDAVRANLGSALYEAGHYEQATEHLRCAVDLNPSAAKHRYNLAAALQACDLLDAARMQYDEAIALEPDFADAHNALGVLFYRERRLAEARAELDRALALDPCNPDYRLNRAYALLLDGSWGEGWREHEWRLLCRGGETGRALSVGVPKIEPGVTVRLVSEQGYGDCIQFVRYASRLAAAGMTVVLQTYPALVRLFESVRGVTAVVDAPGAPACERVYSLMSLPVLFGTLPEDPHETPYLSAPANAIERWRSKVGALKGLKVGLVWAGSSRRENAEAARVDRRRSMPFEALATLGCVDRVAFVSLQVGPRAIDHAAATSASKLELADWTSELHDFAETAALLTHLDLVICVDTAVAHLAGALGKPVWMLSRFDGCWRWLLAGRRTPWYSSMRIYRQPAPGDWATVVNEVARDLADLADRSTSG